MKRKITTALQGVLVLGCFLGIMGIAGYIENHYSMNTTVGYYKNQVCFIDEMGESWSDDRINNYKIGDKVRLVFDNNTTDNTRLDDKIFKIK